MSEQHRDRPDREKIDQAGIVLCYALFAYNDGLISEDVMNCYRDTFADEISALIPDEKEIRRQGWEEGYQKGQQHSIGTDAKLVEEAKREERERIMGEIGRHTYNIRCLPFQATKIRFIRIREPDWQALKQKG